MFGKKKITNTELATHESGLLQEFASALANHEVVDGLSYEAQQNEAMAMQQITSVNAHNNVYVTPADIPFEQQATIAKASIDAHMQKAQAMQVAAYTDQQVQQAELRVKEKYIGLKVTVKVIISEPWPVDTCYRDPQGRYHMNEHGPHKVSGYIEDINLKKDFIIIRPTRLFKAVNNTIQFHRIYMIVPGTFRPLVSLSFT